MRINSQDLVIVLAVIFMLSQLCNWLYIDCTHIKLLLVFFFLLFASLLFVALVANKAIINSGGKLFHMSVTKFHYKSESWVPIYNE